MNTPRKNATREAVARALVKKMDTLTRLGQPDDRITRDMMAVDYLTGAQAALRATDAEDDTFDGLIHLIIINGYDAIIPYYLSTCAEPAVAA